MICIPGLTDVVLRAMSVSRLISIPGDTSMVSDASPASGRKPWATVPRNAAYWAWRLSRKTYARRSILPMCALLSRDDLDAGGCPDAGRAGRDHVLHILGGADPAGRLDAHLRADRLAHERDVEDGGPARRVPGRRLDHVRLRLPGELTGDHLLLVGEKRRLDDHLVGRSGLMARVRDTGDVLANRVEHPALEGPNVDHHVDLAGPVPDRPPRLEGLDLARGRPEREADDRRNRDVRAAQVLRRAVDPGGVDADGGEAMLGGLAAEPVDVRGRRVGPQQGVVDVAGEVAGYVGGVALVHDTRGAAGDDVANLRGALGRARPAARRAGSARIGGGTSGTRAGAEGGEHLPRDRLHQLVSLAARLGHPAWPSPGARM